MPLLLVAREELSDVKQCQATDPPIIAGDTPHTHTRPVGESSICHEKHTACLVERIGLVAEA